MLRLVYTGILCLTSVVSFAQKLQPKKFFLPSGALSIQGGFSVPVADYAATDYSLEAGYAKIGLHTHAAIMYDIAPVIGVTLQYQYNENPWDNDAILNDLRADVAGNNTISISGFHSDAWVLHGMMAGVYYPLRTYKSTLNIELMGGYLSGTLPANELTYVVNGNRLMNIKQSATDATDLGYQVGVSFRHQLYEKLVLTAAFHYTYAKIEFTNIRAIETVTQTPLSVPDYTQRFRMLNASVGLGFMFE